MAIYNVYESVIKVYTVEADSEDDAREYVEAGLSKGEEIGWEVTEVELDEEEN